VGFAPTWFDSKDGAEFLSTGAPARRPLHQSHRRDSDADPALGAGLSAVALFCKKQKPSLALGS